MSELKQNGCFKEAVCIEAMRVFDSCSSQDCLEDLEISFNSQSDQARINCAKFIKCKCVEVINTTFQIDPVPFNKGFFTVDLTYTFKVDFEVYSDPSQNPCFVSGITTFNKKVILFGSDGNTKHFNSDETSQPVINGCCYTNLPRATVSVVDPICLDTKLLNRCSSCSACSCSSTADDTDSASSQGCGKLVLVTIGMFAIVQLQRAVPILIPAYDYCVPQKECSTNTDSPCELFEKIKFPTSEFFPKSLDSDDMPGAYCGNFSSEAKEENDTESN